MTFTDLKLRKELVQAAKCMNYISPTPIQAMAIPPILLGKDLIGCAQTGTGKTAAFALPILHRLQKGEQADHRIRALILTPTRELAIQIQTNLEQYGQFLPLRSTAIFGGVGQNPQVEAISRGIDILVATPGRLNDLCNQGFISLAQLEIFVLDEADRMLDMGFIHDVKKVLARLPKKRQTLLFSATMPKEIVELSKTILHDPVRVEAAPQSSTVRTIHQQVYRVEKAEKADLLERLLKEHDWESVIVFTNTKHKANRVADSLSKAGIPTLAIHGNKSQSARVKALESFKSGTIRVLAATDIAARGIDIEELACVINYELPNIPETYVHRIGRTGRAGRGGMAVSFCDPTEAAYLKDIEKLIGKRIRLSQKESVEASRKVSTPEPKPTVQQTEVKPKPVRTKPKDKKQENKAPAPIKAVPTEKHGKTEKTQTVHGKGNRKAPVSGLIPELDRPVPKGEKIKLELLELPEEPGKNRTYVQRRKISSDPWVPGRVVAFADGRKKESKDHKK